jgi:ABC-type uncharacterized transport system substrate-binding protein
LLRPVVRLRRLRQRPRPRQSLSYFRWELIRSRLRELIPTAKLIALLINPTSPFITESISKDLQSATRALGLELHILHASTEHDFDTVFATLAQLRADVLVIAPDAMFISRSEKLGALTLRHAMPAVTQFREFAAAGGLMSYGGSFTEPTRLVGVYTGRALKGEKPADLPVMQATKVGLVINLKTAKAFGINVPNTLIGRADEVIE